LKDLIYLQELRAADGAQAIQQSPQEPRRRIHSARIALRRALNAATDADDRIFEKANRVVQAIQSIPDPGEGLTELREAFIGAGERYLQRNPDSWFHTLARQAAPARNGAEPTPPPISSVSGEFAVLTPASELFELPLSVQRRRLPDYAFQEPSSQASGSGSQQEDRAPVALPPRADQHPPGAPAQPTAYPGTDVLRQPMPFAHLPSGHPQGAPEARPREPQRRRRVAQSSPGQFSEAPGPGGSQRQVRPPVAPPQSADQYAPTGHAPPIPYQTVAAGFYPPAPPRRHGQAGVHRLPPFADIERFQDPSSRSLPGLPPVAAPLRSEPGLPPLRDAIPEFDSKRPSERSRSPPPQPTPDRDRARRNRQRSR
jgi:hypothetical protein